MLISSVLTLTPKKYSKVSYRTRGAGPSSRGIAYSNDCRFEARQSGNLNRFVPDTASFAVISWRILYATLLPD
jgi:hypothetical protein